MNEKRTLRLGLLAFAALFVGTVILVAQPAFAGGQDFDDGIHCNKSVAVPFVHLGGLGGPDDPPASLPAGKYWITVDYGQGVGPTGAFHEGMLCGQVTPSHTTRDTLQWMGFALAVGVIVGISFTRRYDKSHIDLSIPEFVKQV